ncbi:hypothetical protein Vadar_016308 [Vaccinium darrowii]|uniref:Uncharacterized protein n=1 Tax=Vaccinium darrowii TaxID=229202 RepID=A0ACB7YDT0_9ERIC|nr:hypothetical protein Vadar_016308 [Vaccinium darrowii]
MNNRPSSSHRRRLPPPSSSTSTKTEISEFSRRETCANGRMVTNWQQWWDDDNGSSTGGIRASLTSMVKEKFLESICVAASEETTEKDNWSNLPALLAWMIKDRLNYPNNLRFSIVCKSWLHASLRYQPIIVDAPAAPPWLMIARTVWESNREFINTSTGEKYNIDLPDLCTTNTLFSSKSWLLLEKLDYKSNREFDSPFFLLNPFTKAKIKLPCTAEGLYRGAFDVVNGNPHCVVLATTRSDCINLSITHPGDNTWATYTYRFRDPAKFHFVVIDWVVITGKLVYCVNFTTRAFVFDLANLEWTDLMGKAYLVCTKFLSRFMESQGKLLQLHCPSWMNDTSLVLYRLNDSSTKSEPLDHKDLDDTCLFFSMKDDRLTFIFKGKGMDKIYNSCGRHVNFQFRDTSNLIRGKRGQLYLDLKYGTSSMFNSVCWVDMG